MTEIQNSKQLSPAAVCPGSNGLSRAQPVYELEETKKIRLSGKSKLIKKTLVGAASSHDRFNSRLEAAPTKSNTLVLFR